MNPIEEVDEWCHGFGTEDRHPENGPLGDVRGDDVAVIKEVLDHAKKSDKYVRQMYEVIGFMFKDASKAMSQGRLKAYMDIELDDMFERVHEIMELPAPLDMAPCFDDIPDAANDLPSIVAPSGKILTKG